MRKSKEIPKFKNEAEEREFWTNQDSTDFVDWDNAEFVDLPNLNPTLNLCQRIEKGPKVE